jgi:hypothetical protein
MRRPDVRELQAVFNSKLRACTPSPHDTWWMQRSSGKVPAGLRRRI